MQHGVSSLLVMRAWLLAVVLAFGECRYVIQASTLVNFSPCQLTNLEMVEMAGEDELQACIYADAGPDKNQTVSSSSSSNRTATVTLVQVTPNNCHHHRDGAIIAVQQMNADYEGQGVPIGFNSDFFVKFRLVSIVAGNWGYPGYEERHRAALESLLQTLQPQYIVGSCSWAAAYDKELAERYQTIVMSQVGPPGFYRDDNKYVFGMHVNSDGYPIPALQQYRFSNQKRQSRPLKVIYRTKSEFFASTCRSVLNKAQEFSLDDVQAMAYDPEKDDNLDGTPNSLDVPFLQNLADKACPPNTTSTVYPALFLCVMSNLEINTLLERFKHNACKPSMIWATPATWTWAHVNPALIPYFMGGGQWHTNFDYSDKYFASGSMLLEYNLELNGYAGTYDLVASYAIPQLYHNHLVSHFRVQDDPQVFDTFAERYEELRRTLMIMNANTIFGPVHFDKFQRNNGRSAAGVQWLSRENEKSTKDASIPVNLTVQEECVAPLDQASAKAIYPMPNTYSCQPGQFVNLDWIRQEECLLCPKCSPCPVDTFTSSINSKSQCQPCPAGSSTEGNTGQHVCIRHDPDLLPKSLLAMGYTFVTINFLLGLFFMAWLLHNKHDPVVKLGQMEFLFTICVGAILSTSSIIPLGVQADVGQNVSGATLACRMAPFLYTVGWSLQYSSLFAKAHRLLKVWNNPRLQRRQLLPKDFVGIIMFCVAVDLVVVTLWTIVDPLTYVRNFAATETDPNTGIMTIRSTGLCRSDSSPYFLVVLVALHSVLMTATNVSLQKVRDVSDRYQERKYVGLGSLLALQLLVLGLPSVFAVQDNASARYIAFSGIIFLNDSGLLCLIFIPKIGFQRQGLPEGVSPVQSLAAPILRWRTTLTSGIRRVSMIVTGSSRRMNYRRSTRSTNVPPVKVEEGEKRNSVVDPALADVESENEVSVEKETYVTTGPDSDVREEHSGCERGGVCDDLQTL